MEEYQRGNWIRLINKTALAGTIVFFFLAWLSSLMWSFWAMILFSILFVWSFFSILKKEDDVRQEH